MRIVSSQIALSAEQSHLSATTTEVQGRSWIDSSDVGARVQISEAARNRLTTVAASTLSAPTEKGVLVSAAQPRFDANERANGIQTTSSSTALGESTTNASSKIHELDEVSDDDLLNSPDGGKLFVLKRLIEAITGQKVRVVRANDLQNNGDESSISNAESVTKTNNEGNAPDNERVGWGVELDVKTIETRSARSDVTAQGNLVTADGQTITFSASFLKERTNVTVTNVSLRAGDAKLKDPLVLLYSGTSTELSTRATTFDLDNDGILDNLPGVANGAYVINDRNYDGKVNDASELFGALSNDGFADLRALDDDGNGFIDGGDSHYSSLYLWDPLAAPEAQLTALADANIGALFTGQVSSPFEIRDSTGALQGRIRATGIYVTEGGEIRPLEQVDLAQTVDGTSERSPVDLKA
jgi:hypothetical protein